MHLTPDQCPCGSPFIGLVEILTGVASLEGGENDGEFEYAGETDVLWDSQHPDIALGDGDNKEYVKAVCEDRHEIWVELTPNLITNQAQRDTIAQLSQNHAPRDGSKPADVGEVRRAMLDQRTPPAVEVWISGIFYHIEPDGEAHS